MSHEVIQQIRNAMERAGLSTARELALAIDPDAGWSQINLLQRKLAGSRRIGQRDLEKVAEATESVYRQTLAPKRKLR